MLQLMGGLCHARARVSLDLAHLPALLDSVTSRADLDTLGCDPAARSLGVLQYTGEVQDSQISCSSLEASCRVVHGADEQSRATQGKQGDATNIGVMDGGMHTEIVRCMMARKM